MTNTANDLVKPERIYEALQFELHDAPQDIKAYSLLACLTTGELITNDTLMNAIQMGFNMLPRVAPTLGDRVRIIELLSDEVRHCYMNDHLARALGGGPSKVNYFAPNLTEAAPDLDGMLQGSRESDQLASGESTLEISGGDESVAAIPQLIAGGMANGMATGGSYLWTMFAVFNTCIDRVAGMMIKDTINSSFAPLARMNRSIAVDEAGHAQTGYHHLRDVCATPEGRQEAQTAVDAIWPISLAMFDMLPPKHVEECLRLGLPRPSSRRRTSR